MRRTAALRGSSPQAGSGFAAAGRKVLRLALTRFAQDDRRTKKATPAWEKQNYKRERLEATPAWEKQNYKRERLEATPAWEKQNYKRERLGWSVCRTDGGMRSRGGQRGDRGGQDFPPEIGARLPSRGSRRSGRPGRTGGWPRGDGDHSQTGHACRNPTPAAGAPADRSGPPGSPARGDVENRRPPTAASAAIVPSRRLPGFPRRRSSRPDRARGPRCR